MESVHTSTPASDTPTELLTIGEAARLLRVSVDTVRRWADAGRLRVIVLPSGHRRFYAGDIAALLDQGKAAS